ncbi:5'-nucleotidase [sulfur-oxidizing endosymbiont of Gigantopelta aegis]|uniref:5'-nucleotidase n=1 Tax=sulfur-oxidizing endosymbiont of Gigantopelta aegis TaxID=2794934 RepID=UPI0018DEC27A|nr:5'-nucleotidase [sulfur-oxidizing endosymbiont of Gigantopelta aegis]
MKNHNKLTIAISSRALFDLEEGHKVFTEQGVEAYCRYQIEHENDLLEPGVAFSLVKKLLALNGVASSDSHLAGSQADQDKKVEVILLSKNSADTGLRIFNSIVKHDLDICRAAFSSGESPYRYIEPFGADLFLSAEANDVREALDMGFAAAAILPSASRSNDKGQLRIAFDGDAVIFSDDAERIYKQKGLAAFDESERVAANDPLPGGPFKEFLKLLHQLQSNDTSAESPIRTALVTARGAPAHERVIRTLRAWDIRIDEAIFLGGKSKGEFLKAFGADIFFDDQMGHCESAAEHVPSAQVLHGVANQK